MHTRSNDSSVVALFSPDATRVGLKIEMRDKN